jgi:hypothetical protein
MGLGEILTWASTHNFLISASVLDNSVQIICSIITIMVGNAKTN